MPGRDDRNVATETAEAWLELEARADGGAGAPQANIHPETGLATDYLNHFNEVIMLIDMLPAMPECAEDILRWRPASYTEHFARSRLRDAGRVLAAYDTVEPARRDAFEHTVRGLDMAIVSAQRLIADDTSAGTTKALGALAEADIRPRLERAIALINGAPPDVRPLPSDAQAAIDALFRP
jgi:hypothetical protein